MRSNLSHEVVTWLAHIVTGYIVWIVSLCRFSEHRSPSTSSAYSETLVLILTYLDVSLLTIFASSRWAVVFVFILFKNLFKFTSVTDSDGAFCFQLCWGMQIADHVKTAAMLVLLLAVFSSFHLIAAGKTKNASQPHIIFILSDDLVRIHTEAKFIYIFSVYISLVLVDY